MKLVGLAIQTYAKEIFCWPFPPLQTNPLPDFIASNHVVHFSFHPYESFQLHICTQLFSSQVLHCSPSLFSLDRHSGPPRIQKMLIFLFITVTSKSIEGKKGKE